MKNILRNAALLSASLLALDVAAEGAASQGPVLSFGGSITGAAIGTQQKVRLQGNSPAVNFMSKGNLVMNVGGTANNGMGYGGVAVLNFDKAKGGNERISEAYIYMNHDCIGSLKIGDTEDVTQIMMYTGADVLGGLGGTMGDLNKFINMIRTVDFRPSIAPANDKATKIVWVSPEIRGFQAGIGFTPSTKLHGRVTRGVEFNPGPENNTLKNASFTPYSTNTLTGGLSYNKAFSKCNLGLYVVGQSGKSKNDATLAPKTSAKTYKHTSGYQVGTLLDYQNWQFGASWFDKKKTLVRSSALTAGHTNTKGIDAAVGYDFARNANVAIGHTHTYRKVTGGDAKADVTTVTLDYVMAPGWVAFAELDHFRLKAPAAAVATATGPSTTGIDIYANRDGLNRNNHGTVLVLGTKLRF
ncbi:porin [Alphaproteobacteria bacterium]|nr:porin [Alphaproteobacteria bacterium]